MNVGPDSRNLILARGDGERNTVGSRVVRSGSQWFKTWSNGRYVLHNDDSLSLNTLAVEQLERWKVTLLYYVHGKGRSVTLYKTTLRDMLRLGNCTEHPGWGWNLSLPMPLWTIDRSGFDVGFVPNGWDHFIRVPAEVPRPVWAPAHIPVHKQHADSQSTEPTQLGLFDAARERVA